MSQGAGERKARARLDRDVIFRTAVQIADSEGVEAVSMRKIAGKLSVEAMSLYHHIPNKDAILKGMVDLVLGEIEILGVEQVWKERLRGYARSIRKQLARHPWSLPLLSTFRNPGPETLSHYETILGIFLDAGFNLETTAHCYSLLDSYIYGFVQQSMSFAMGAEEHGTVAPEQSLLSMELDSFPNLKRMMREYASRPEYSFEDEFEFGLTVVLDAIEGLNTGR